MTDAQFQVVVGLLTDIRNGIAFLCEEPESEPAPDEATAACPHDEADRIDFSTPGETHWQCKCGHVVRRRGHQPCAG